MYFLITGFGDEMEESGLEEAVLVQEEDEEEEEETGSRRKRFWNIHFQVSALASVSLRIKVMDGGGGWTYICTYERVCAPPVLQRALEVLLIQRFGGFCCVPDVPEDRMKKRTTPPSEIKDGFH